MRKIELLIGAAALVVASVSATLYLVNQQERAKRSAAPASIAQEEPQVVLSASDLLGAPAEDVDSMEATVAEIPATTITVTFEEPERAGRKPSPRAQYPDWQAGGEYPRVEQARAISTAGSYIKPRWSPVGTDIVFTSDDLAGLHLGGTTPGSAIRTLLFEAGSGRDYKWNSDGMSLRVVALDEKIDEIVITGERYPAPRQQERVVVRDDRIYFVATPFMGREGEVLISGPEDQFRDPVLSPDETKVVFTGAETGLYIGWTNGSRVILVGKGRNPTWLPDSSGIVYDQPMSDGRSLIDGDLWMALADGTIRTNLTNTPGIVETYPNVAPDGERIAFASEGTVYVGKLIRKPTAY
jgi:hypothetical protein